MLDLTTKRYFDVRPPEGPATWITPAKGGVGFTCTYCHSPAETTSTIGTKQGVITHLISESHRVGVHQQLSQPLITGAFVIRPRHGAGPRRMATKSKRDSGRGNGNGSAAVSNPLTAHRNNNATLQSRNRRATKPKTGNKTTFLGSCKNIILQHAYTSQIKFQSVPVVSAIVQQVVDHVTGWLREPLTLPKGSSAALQHLAANVNEFVDGGDKQNKAEMTRSAKDFALYISHQVASERCGDHAQCMVDAWVAMLTSPHLLSFTLGIDGGKHPINPSEKPVAAVMRAVLNVNGVLKTATGLIHLENAGVLGKGKHHALRTKLLLARLCGHNGKNCSCYVPNQQEFDAGHDTDSDEDVNLPSSGDSSTDADSDDEYWVKRGASKAATASQVARRYSKNASCDSSDPGGARSVCVTWTLGMLGLCM